MMTSEADMLAGSQSHSGMSWLLPKRLVCRAPDGKPTRYPWLEKSAEVA